MEQLLCHLFGDFMVQTSWMALNKHDRWFPAIVHGIVYTALFSLLTHDLWRLAIIGGSHILIDHYRLAGVWARLINWEWEKEQPVVPSWVISVIDQTLHLTINWLVLVL